MKGHAQIPVLVLVGNARRVWSKSYWSERLLLTSVGFGSGPWKNVSMKRMHLLWPWFSKVFEHAQSFSMCTVLLAHTCLLLSKACIAPWMAIKNLHCAQPGLRFFSLRSRGQEVWSPSPPELWKSALCKGNPCKILYSWLEVILTGSPGA